MSLTISQFKFDKQHLFEIASNIRKAVFVDEQGVDANLEIDEFEKDATHVLAYKNNIPIATARYRKKEHGIKLERFAVLKEYRNNNVGQKILSAIINASLNLNLPIYLNAQISAVKFYLKNGFEKDGESFFEAGIEHCRMVYKDVH